MNPILSCYIVDDEPFSIEAIKEEVLITPELQLVGTSTNPFEALAYLQEHEVALIFLDITMGKISGMEFSKFVSSKIIWVTAHEKFALQSYDFENTVDYLLKPIAHDRFQFAVKKALKSCQKPLEKAAIKEEFTLSLKTTQGKREILYGLIDYIEAERNVCFLYSGKEKITVHMTLKQLELSLPSDLFARVHKSYLINRTKVKYVRFNKVMLYGNTAVPIGRTYKFEKK